MSTVPYLFDDLSLCCLSDHEKQGICAALLPVCRKKCATVTFPASLLLRINYSTVGRTSTVDVKLLRRFQA